MDDITSTLSYYMLLRAKLHPIIEDRLPSYTICPTAVLFHSFQQSSSTHFHSLVNNFARQPQTHSNFHALMAREQATRDGKASHESPFFVLSKLSTFLMASSLSLMLSPTMGLVDPHGHTPTSVSYGSAGVPGVQKGDLSCYVSSDYLL